MTLPIAGLRLVRLPGAALIALAAVTGTAIAQVTPEQQGAIRSNCRSDFTSKCSGVTPGGKDALACLQKNVASLSPACKTAVSATLPAPAPATPAQAAPAAAPPPPAATAKTAPVVSAPPPPAKPARPVKRPAAAAAATPATTAPAVAAAQPTATQQSAMRSSCRSDFMSKCSGVTPGGKDALACLQKNVTTLSAACKKVVSSTMSAPAAGAAAPAAAPPPAAAAPASKGVGFVPGGILIQKACARYILMHCNGLGLGMERKVACLVDYSNSGKFVGPRCKAVLKMTGHLR